MASTRWSRYVGENHHTYQDRKLSEMSDHDIIMGMIEAYKESPCTAHHWESGNYPDCLSNDECYMFTYPSGGRDHWHIRWFKEWCQEHRPHILKRLYGLKAFW